MGDHDTGQAGGRTGLGSVSRVLATSMILCHESIVCTGPRRGPGSIDDLLFAATDATPPRVECDES